MAKPILHAKGAREARIMHIVRKFADSIGVPSVRMAFMPGVERGFPDVMFLVPGGAPFFIEFKRPRGQPTKLQARWIARLSGLGYGVAVCCDVKEAQDLLTGAVAMRRP